jgi:hypothetical protein
MRCDAALQSLDFATTRRTAFVAEICPERQSENPVSCCQKSLTPIAST